MRLRKSWWWGEEGKSYIYTHTLLYALKKFWRYGIPESASPLISHGCPIGRIWSGEGRGFKGMPMICTTPSFGRYSIGPQDLSLAQVDFKVSGML